MAVQDTEESLMPKKRKYSAHETIPCKSKQAKKAATDVQDAERWRKIRPWLAVNHVFDVGRIGFAPKNIAKIEFNRGQEHPLRIETPDDGMQGPWFTVEEVIDKFTPAPKKRPL